LENFEFFSGYIWDLSGFEEKSTDRNWEKTVLHWETWHQISVTTVLDWFMSNPDGDTTALMAIHLAGHWE